MIPLHISITATSAPLVDCINGTTCSYGGRVWSYGGCCAKAAIGLSISGGQVSESRRQALVDLLQDQ